MSWGPKVHLPHWVKARQERERQTAQLTRHGSTLTTSDVLPRLRRQPDYAYGDPLRRMFRGIVSAPERRILRKVAAHNRDRA